MKTIKVADATDTQLNYLVAVAEILQQGMGIPVADMANFKPTTDAVQAYKIVNREFIAVGPGVDNGDWYARCHSRIARGKTPLVAAMRAWVRDQCGDVARVPEGLV